MNRRDPTGEGMSKIQIRIAICCCLFALAALAPAQGRKPGLWETTMTMTWQQTPLPPGMQLPPGVTSPFAPTTRTLQVCLTQAIIDKFGAPLSTPQDNCTISNIDLKPNGMSAEMTCTGKMSIHATMKSFWTADDNTAKGKVHATGTMQMGANPATVEYTIESTSVYKGADCGSVKPMPMPATK
jgi:hypothetical protein